jgi:hypothetical protein
MAPKAVVDQLVKEFVNFEGVRPRAQKRMKVDLKVSANDLSLTVNLNNLKQFKAVSLCRLAATCWGARQYYWYGFLIYQYESLTGST